MRRRCGAIWIISRWDGKVAGRAEERILVRVWFDENFIILFKNHILVYLVILHLRLGQLTTHGQLILQLAAHVFASVPFLDIEVCQVSIDVFKDQVCIFVSIQILVSKKGRISSQLQNFVPKFDPNHGQDRHFDIVVERNFYSSKEVLLHVQIKIVAKEGHYFLA